MLIGTALLGLLAIACGLLDRGGRLPRRVAGWWGRLLLWLWSVRVVVHGEQHVPPGAAVFAVNHQSALDIPILFAHLPADFRIVHKHSLYWIPVLGWYLFLGGHIGVHRGRAFRARRSLHHAARRIRAGTSVAVFPEGTRSADASVQPFKRGSFVLAIEAGAPIVPVSLCGVKRLAPAGLLRLKPGTVTLTIHPAVTTSTRSRDDAAALAEEVRQVVADGCRAA